MRLQHGDLFLPGRSPLARLLFTIDEAGALHADLLALKKEKRASKKAFVALVMLLTALTIVSVCLSVYASRSQRRIANYERILAEGGQMGDAGRFEAPVPDEVPKIEMRKVGDARVSPLHYGDDAAEGV